jgi:hypothetical protein
MTTAAIREVLDRARASISGAGQDEGTSPHDAGPIRPSILPKNYLVEFIAGTFGPAASGQGLTEHLESEQNVRRVVNRTNLGVMTAQNLEENSRRKLEEVHVTRAVKFKHAIAQIADYLGSAARDQDRPHVIREIFFLDDSEVAQRIAVRMAETRFLERLALKGTEIPEAPLAWLQASSTASHFVELEGRFRTEFASFIPDLEEDDQGVPRPVGDDKALKIVNRVFDEFAPRMFLIGHSQGGLVALRAMQLGMRRTRVKNSRRFLYSPRSGRVHRYSPVALAIGLGSPFDGIDRSPPGRQDKRYAFLRLGGVQCVVKTWIPGVDQMRHGSDFLKTLRGAFIPYDCSAISVANPEDGIVPLGGTRLPVGDFRNMHNLEVGSSNPFDVAEMVPPTLRPALQLGMRKLVNEHAWFEGLRQHCSFLFDLGETWDVDKGEIVRQIFSGKSGESVFDEMMHGVNFDGVREQLMANLLYRLRRSTPEERGHLAWMTPRLRHMIDEEALPFINSLDKRALLALNYIEPQ